MSREKTERSERSLTTLMVGRDFANRLRVIAGHRGITMAEAMEKLLRPTLDREYRKVVAEVGAEPTAKAGG